jgi:2-keto-4-pentenoate hydratase/2-oxohepta-3-ene-1,7-dioic acid hydratase in catechol pathway
MVMRLMTFSDAKGPRIGVLMNNAVVDLAAILEADRGEDSATNPRWAYDMLSLIEAGPAAMRTVRQFIEELEGMPAQAGRGFLRLGDIELMAPIPRPRKNVLCVGLNYTEHCEETASVRVHSPEIPEYPAFFTKPPTAVIGPGDSILLDEMLTQKLDYEVELAVVIGREGINIAEDEALSFVFGYTILNDISARDLQRRHGQWFKGKCLDTTCPLGPCIVTAQDVPNVQDLDLALRLNGEIMQSSNTHYMHFTVAELISQLSRGMTLEPGDIIATGTPGGVGSARQPPVYLKNGDVIEAEIEGIGILSNTVVALRASR